MKNTEDFVAKLKSISTHEDEVLVSFDVKSLFTSVPVPDAINAITETIANDEEFKTRTGLEPATLIEMIRICLSSTSFCFRSQHYELTDGLAMGSPLSPAVANIFMTALEEKALATFPNAPTIWFRFVDDIFSIVEKKEVKALLQHLNAQHPSIKFTFEHEEEGKLPFMDVSVHRCDEGSLKTSIYRKPTHTGAYLNYDSNHPASAKHSVITSLMGRVKNITLGDNEKRREEKRVKEDLHANGYPLTTIRRVTARLEKNQAAKKNQDAAPPPEQRTVITTAIPYIPGVSEAVSRIVAPLGIRTVMKPMQRKWSLMKGVKDAQPADGRPGVVYALGCMDCQKVYIGETARTAQQRVKEHQGHTKKGFSEMSAVAKHVVETNHRIHWKPRILKTEQRSTQRKVHEALVIHALAKKSEDTVMNQDRGMELSHLWLP